MSKGPTRARQSRLFSDLINCLSLKHNTMHPATTSLHHSRGDRGINPLDEAINEHDFWYSLYKDAEVRWVVPKVLQDIAFDLLLSWREFTIKYMFKRAMIHSINFILKLI